MDMDISNFKCPQYVNFEEEVLKNSSFVNGANDTLSSLLIKDAVSETMDIEDDYFCSTNATPSNNNSFHDSMYSDPYLVSNSYQKSPSCYSLRSGSGVENYPVKVHVNQSVIDGIKKNTRIGKITKSKSIDENKQQKRKREDGHVPLAEQVATFHRKTPQRFHSVGSKEFQPQKHWSPPRATLPKSPNLQAAKRIRGTDVLSREETEELEVAAMKRYKFRARPARQSILNKRQSLKASKKLATKAKGFQLRTAQRAAEGHSRKEKEEKPYEFHAQPVPLAIFDGPKGLKEKPSIPATLPKTPNFALKKRAEKWSQNIQPTVEVPKFKAHPLPVSEPFVVKHEKKPIVVQPFSFESKQQEWMAKKEQKIQEVIEKENKAFVFKAQPMPSYSPDILPAVPKKPPTAPQPFHFQHEEKSSRHSSLGSSTEQPCPTFKARPATILKKQPFIPEKSGKYTTEVQEFQLHTDVRASERLKLKEINRIKEKENEKALARQRLLQEEEERKEIERIRREAEFKANPIRLCKPLEIKPSDRPVTIPITPKFKTDKRLQAKN